MTVYLWVVLILFLLGAGGAFIFVGEGGKVAQSKGTCLLNGFTYLAFAIWTVVMLVRNG